MQCLRRYIVIFLCILSASAAADDLEVITLKYRTAEQLIPVIRPLLAPGGAVSGMQNQLILRTSKSNLQDIKKMLVSLDAMPRRLMIYVRQSAEGAGAQNGAELSSRIGGAATGAQHMEQERHGVTARIYETRGARDERITQQIQVMEGNAATIQIGQSVPVATPTVTRSINGIAFTDTVAYRDFVTGFEVVPRVSGERVFLDLSPRRETPTGSRGGGDVQRASTTASGRLGEWFEIGGSMRNDARSDSGLLLGAAGQRKDKQSIWVKVEEIK